ncbi:MAG: DUF3810 family protein [Clostridia bacterium]|nr:DUF3810 family protein [Clostridia bacterium]
MKLRHKKLIKKLIAAAVILAVVIVFSALKHSQSVSEYMFARGFSRAYIYVISSITSVFAFSIYEAFVFAMLVLAVILIIKWVRLLKRRKRSLFYKSVLNTFILAMTIVLLYTSTAAFSYYRKPLPIPQYEGEVLDETQLEEIIRYYFAEFEAVSSQVRRDDSGMVVLPYTYAELNDRLEQEFNRLGTLDGYLMAHTPRVKKMVSSEFMSYQRISGLAFTPTGEANINRFDPLNSRTLTMAHEIAHIKGVMVENDANMVSRYLALTSEDIYFRYAGYMYTVNRLLEIAYYTFDKDKYTELYYLYPEAARVERDAEYAYWSKYDSVIDKVSDFMNDLYLKISGVDDGTDNYRDVSDKVIVTDPDTGKPVMKIAEYSPVQKLYIELYLKNHQ